MITKAENPELRQRAERALRGGRWREALGLYGKLLDAVETYDARRYDSWLEGALAAYEALGRTREAGYVLLGLRRYSEAQRHFPPSERPLEWALAAARLGHRAEAARVLSEAGHPVLAAFELEAAGAFAAARLEWERVVRDARLAGLPYERALAHFRLGRALLRTNEAAAGARELATTQRLLETVADEAETHGDTTRALACYLLLIHLGRDTGSFENVAEGFLNSIRILERQDLRKHFASQYYDDFLAFAVERKEWYAAATLAREAATYAAKRRFVFERHYLARAAELWEATAQHNEAAGGPVDLSENALHAAIDVAVSMDDHALVARLYGALAALPLAANRRARYQRLAARGAGVLAAPPPKAPGFPSHLRRDTAYHDPSQDDLVEWALDGDATAVLARFMVGVDREHAGASSDDRKAWRLALRGLLVANAPSFSLQDVHASSEVALALGKLGVYQVLRPLEQLAAHAAPEVRAAVMASVRSNYLERSLALVQRGLSDPSPLVSEEALRSLRRAGYRDGFDPVARVFRDATDDRVRLAVIEAMKGVGTFEAGVFLLDVVRQETGALAAAAAERLSEFQGEDLLPFVRQALEVEAGERRATLERVATKLAGQGR
jgi:hypothetical protein